MSSPRSSPTRHLAGGRNQEVAMRDIKADWHRWSRPERIAAVAIVTLFIIVSGSSALQAFAG
jgi:hypothetical protein